MKANVIVSVWHTCHADFRLTDGIIRKLHVLCYDTPSKQTLNATTCANTRTYVLIPVSLQT